MQVIMDDSVVLIVYALMLTVIIALFFAAYMLYKKAIANSNNVVPEDKDKLTSNRGEPMAKSKFERFDD
jgi:hypothetical protein